MNTRLLRRKNNIGHAPAQTMVEFALVLPVLLLLIFGVMEFSRLLFAWIVIENASRFGVRYATTGNFNFDYCKDVDGDVTPCDGASKFQEIDAARIPSIKDEAHRMIIGFAADDFNLTQEQNDYLKITVCSGRPLIDGSDRIFTRPQMGGPVYSDCTTAEDAGGPGDTVVVSVDYNFPFIILPAFGLLDMIHLASYREGIVEMFRISRTVNTPRPLVVASITLPPTDTGTPSTTPLATNTVTNTVSPSVTFTPSKTFTPSMTFTPSETASPTATPKPTCSKLFFNGRQFVGNVFQVNIKNTNNDTAYLTAATLTWNTSKVPPMAFDYATFNGNKYYDPIPNLTTSPITTPILTPIALNGGATAWWSATFVNAVFTGTYGVNLTFNFPGTGLNCSLARSWTPTVPKTPTTKTPTMKVTPSKTPTASNTPTATSTPPPTITRTPTSIVTETPTLTPTKCQDC